VIGNENNSTLLPPTIYHRLGYYANLCTDSDQPTEGDASEVRKLLVRGKMTSFDPDKFLLKREYATDAGVGRDREQVADGGARADKKGPPKRLRRDKRMQEGRVNMFQRTALLQLLPEELDAGYISPSFAVKKKPGPDGELEGRDTGKHGAGDDALQDGHIRDGTRTCQCPLVPSTAHLFLQRR
jgi:hypothetical protein